jgi:hypothetical protein
MNRQQRRAARRNESQRIVLLGPQCELKEGGMWNPAWDRMQRGAMTQTAEAVAAVSRNK